MAGSDDRILTGFNHNISYGGKMYHIQTEDCGLSNPVVITHIFLEGMVIDTVRSSYSDANSSEDKAEEQVRKLMKKQHLIVIQRLISGNYDGRESGEGNED